MTQFQLGEGSPPEHLDAMRHWQDVVRYWKRFCDANGIALSLVYLPWPEEVDDSLYVVTAVDSLPRWGVVSWVGEFCAEEGIPFLDPIPAFRAATNGRGKRLYWVHLNYEGHRVLAEFLLDALPERVSSR
jgi:hypothetical protein